MTFFNEIDPFAVAWLKRLYPDAAVDRRSIADVQPVDVVRYERCHFFGGIGGWEYALHLAGWPAWRSVWTGSCPCQPLSCAGKRTGEADERHLWPEFYRLIAECGPATIFGEQVASKDGLEWLDGISLDLEELGYAVGAADLPAASQGAPHIRQRFFWVAVRQLGYADSARRDAWSPQRQERGSEGEPLPAARGEAGGLADGASRGRGEFRGSPHQGDLRHADGGCEIDRMGNADREGHEARADKELSGTRRRGEGGATEQSGSAWGPSLVIPCADGKLRRISAQSGDEPLAARIPKTLGRSKSRLRRMGQRARANRVGRLRGYGNAICPQAAALFVRAFLEATATQEVA